MSSETYSEGNHKQILNQYSSEINFQNSGLRFQTEASDSNFVESRQTEKLDELCCSSQDDGHCALQHWIKCGSCYKTTRSGATYGARCLCWGCEHYQSDDPKINHQICHSVQKIEGDSLQGEELATTGEKLDRNLIDIQTERSTTMEPLLNRNKQIGITQKKTTQYGESSTDQVPTDEGATQKKRFKEPSDTAQIHQRRDLMFSQTLDLPLQESFKWILTRNQLSLKNADRENIANSEDQSSDDQLLTQPHSHSKKFQNLRSSSANSNFVRDSTNRSVAENHQCIPVNVPNVSASADPREQVTKETGYECCGYGGIPCECQNFGNTNIKKGTIISSASDTPNLLESEPQGSHEGERFNEHQTLDYESDATEQYVTSERHCQGVTGSDSGSAIQMLQTLAGKVTRKETTECDKIVDKYDREAFVRGARQFECKSQQEPDLLPSKRPDRMPFDQTNSSSAPGTKIETRNSTRKHVFKQRLNSTSQKSADISELCGDLKKLRVRQRQPLAEYEQEQHLPNGTHFQGTVQNHRRIKNREASQKRVARNTRSFCNDQTRQPGTEYVSFKNMLMVVFIITCICSFYQSRTDLQEQSTGIEDRTANLESSCKAEIEDQHQKNSKQAVPIAGPVSIQIQVTQQNNVPKQIQLASTDTNEQKRNSVFKEDSRYTSQLTADAVTYQGDGERQDRLGDALNMQETFRHREQKSIKQKSNEPVLFQRQLLKNDGGYMVQNNHAVERMKAMDLDENTANKLQLQSDGTALRSNLNGKVHDQPNYDSSDSDQHLPQKYKTRPSSETQSGINRKNPLRKQLSGNRAVTEQKENLPSTSTTKNYLQTKNRPATQIPASQRPCTGNEASCKESKPSTKTLKAHFVPSARRRKKKVVVHGALRRGSARQRRPDKPQGIMDACVPTVVAILGAVLTCLGAAYNQIK